MSKPESELIADRLAQIRAEKERISDRMEELNGEESKLTFALEVFRSFVADRPVVTGLLAQAMGEVQRDIERLYSPDAGVLNAVEPHLRPQAKNLEASIASFLRETGSTSAELADTVMLFVEAKRESILSTLSRMVGKGAARREGKLYFPPRAKSEGSEAVEATDPSIATKSGQGQAVSDDDLA